MASSANRAELGFGLAWAAFGATVLAASWRMDRLESLNINPWSAPGLMPGVLGALMTLFGAALAVRAFGTAGEAVAIGSWRRVGLALFLCVGYAGGLLGRTLPFWLTSAVFLFVTIVTFRLLDDRDVPLARVVASSTAIALGAALVISYVFETVFLVRLP